MDFTAFFQEMKNHIDPLYLMDGEEEFIKQRAVQQLISTLLDPSLAQMNQTTLVNPLADDVINACETLPFLAERRLVWVQDWALLQGRAKDEANEVQKMLDYLPRLPASTCLLLTLHGKADGRKKLVQELQARNCVHTFDTMDETECVRWLKSTARKIGSSINDRDAAYLCYRSGRDAALLNGELAKLAAYAGEGQPITRQQIDEIATPSIECTVFEMVDALVAGKADEAFSLYRNLILTGSERLGILAMIQRQYRIMLQVKTMKAAGANDGAIRGALSISSYGITKTARQAGSYGMKKLRDIINMLVETEYLAKSGQINQDGCCEMVMLKLLNGQA